MQRDELRHYARVLKGRWVEDPSNEDRRYDRVRIRHLLKHLGEEGLTGSVLAETANRMARARDGLTARLVEAVDTLCMAAPLGQVRIDRDGFAALDAETQLRMLTAALCYVASAEYRPRAAASEGLLAQVLSGRGGTLHGAEVLVEKAHLRVVREAAAVRSAVSDPGTLWDAQWVLAPVPGSFHGPIEVRALGEAGWRQIADRTALTVPHRAALGLCALWQGESLLACPVLGFGPEIETLRYVLGQPDMGFRAFCLSH
jgi:tRNA(Ile)-lysidine synthase